MRSTFIRFLGEGKTTQSRESDSKVLQAMRAHSDEAMEAKIASRELSVD